MYMIKKYLHFYHSHWSGAFNNFIVDIMYSKARHLLQIFT